MTLLISSVGFSFMIRMTNNPGGQLLKGNFAKSGRGCDPKLVLERFDLEWEQTCDIIDKIVSWVQHCLQVNYLVSKLEQLFVMISLKHLIF